MLDTTQDHRQSPICKKLSNPPVILPASDPWWASHIPPLHFRCRSAIRSLRKEEAEKRGVMKEAPDAKPDNGFGAAPGEEDEWEPDLTKYPTELAKAFLTKPAPEPDQPKPPKAKPEHDPAHWEEEYKHLGGGAKAAAYGHAMKERGLDMPFADVAKHLDALGSYPEYDFRGKALRAFNEETYPTMRDYLRDKTTGIAPHIDAAAAVAGHMKALADAGAASAKLDAVADFSGLKKSAKALAQKNVDRADAFFRSMVSGDCKIDRPRIVFKGARRSYYDDRPHALFVNLRHAGPVLEHELMHAFEQKTPKALASALEFLDARTKGEAWERLDKLYPRQRFKPEEVTTKDKFPHGYMGRRYQTGGVTYATEITSMGVQYLLERPAKFYEEDPEYFHWILGQLSGR